jgi:hypothetical protein
MVNRPAVRLLLRDGDLEMKVIQVHMQSDHLQWNDRYVPFSRFKLLKNIFTEYTLKNHDVKIRFIP